MSLYLLSHDPFSTLSIDCLEDLNDSNHSTMRANPVSLKNPTPNSCCWMYSLQGSSLHVDAVVAPHHELQPIIPTRNVHFSKILHIRQVPHRNDMSFSEFNERWGDDGEDIYPDISPSIFDAHLEEVPGISEESEERRHMRRRAYLIRRRVLSDFSSSAGNDDDAATLARRYTQYAAQSVQEAHVAALKHAHDVELDLDDLSSPTIGSPSFPRKRLSVTQPLAAVKRLRLSS